MLTKGIDIWVNLLH